MLPGYNTNGFAHHRIEDAVEILAELGYLSVALTIDYHALDCEGSPSEFIDQCICVKETLSRNRMRCVVETGARFFLDTRRKHQPTLLDEDDRKRGQRFGFLMMATIVASNIGADAVSFWSGAAPQGTPETVLWKRLVQECKNLCELADANDVRLAFEPEPGMFIDTMPKFEELHRRVNHPRFGLTLDIGHLQCMGEMPSRTHIERWKDVLWNVHIEDMRRGVHDHLPFGEGEIDFDEVFAALRDVGYAGGLHVELSRHSHDAVETARRSMEFMRRWISV